MVNSDTKKGTISMISNIQKILDSLKPFTPDVKSLNVDYLARSSSAKVLIHVPFKKREMFNRIEIPSDQGYKIDEVFDGESLDKLRLPCSLEENKWIIDTKKLPSSEKYFITLKGEVSKNNLDELVRVHSPENPNHEDELDKYWIHSAIKNMGTLEKIYSALSIERVAVSVNVGVNRSFSSSIPSKVRDWLEARAEMEFIIDSGDRQKVFREWIKYRSARRNVGKVSTRDILDISNRLLSKEIFLIFIEVDDPYRIEGITSIEQSSRVPDSIKVNIRTDLNYNRPAAKGNLIFKKKDFAAKITDEFDKIIKRE